MTDPQTDSVAPSAPDAPEYPSPSILDSRRLTGANLFDASPGAVLVIDPRAATPAHIAAWQAHVSELCDALAWSDVHTVIRLRDSSAQLFVRAPLDGLMTATSLNELAWCRAERVSDDAMLRALHQQWHQERTRLAPAAALVYEAHLRGLTACVDDESVTVGSGSGGESWPIDGAPDATAVDWSQRTNVPTVLVTGSNGKTTTTRLIASMFRASGHVAGWSCSDGVFVAGGEPPVQLEAGDYTGPAGARRVLRDTSVQAAVLETARGGLLRRGLALTRADVAVITNISDDHFGEYGVESLADLADAKAIVAHAVSASRGVLVLNADDVTLRTLPIDPAVAVVWFSTSAQPGSEADLRVTHGVSEHGLGARVRAGQLQLAQHGAWHSVGDVASFPLTAGGSALHNIANATAAALAALTAAVPRVAIESVLTTFGANDGDNAGRLMVRRVGGVTVLVDYAHNPAGMTALCATAASMPAARRLLLLGQAGNRDDEQLRALGAAAWHTTKFDRIIIKHLPHMLRGREAAAVPAQLREGLQAAGAPESIVSEASTEFDGVVQALLWAAPGDLLVLGVHVDRTRVLALLDALVEQGWTAGEPVLVGKPVDGDRGVLKAVQPAAGG